MTEPTFGEWYDPSADGVYPAESGGFPLPTLPPPPGWLGMTASEAMSAGPVPSMPPWHPSGPMPVPVPPPPPAGTPPVPTLPVPTQVVPLPPPTMYAPAGLAPAPVPGVPGGIGVERFQRPRTVGDGRRRTVSVDNNRCHLYAICQMEAPSSFEVGADGRLRYDPAPPAALTAQVRQAARLCPMQAIKVGEG